MKKKMVSLVLAAAMLAAMLPATLLPAFSADDDATVIRTADELRSASDGNYRLGADIDLGGQELTAALATLSGTLDGDGHSITNFSLAFPAASAADEGEASEGEASGEGEAAASVNDNGISLFAQGGELTISNLTVGSADAPVLLSGTPAAGMTDCAAVLVAKVLENITFENVRLYVDVRQVSKAYTGGFIGLCDGGTVTIRGCTVNGTMASNIDADNVGMAAFIGTLGGSGSASFEQCVNNASVAITNPAEEGAKPNENAKVGGFIGFVNTGSGKITVRNCINHGEISGHNYVAALFGHLNAGAATVNGFWNSADITARNLFGGAVFGRMHGTSLTVEHVLNSGNVPQATNFTGALGGHHSGGSLTVKNLMACGTSPNVICAGTKPDELSDVYYYGTYGNVYEGAATAAEAKALESSDAALEQANAEGFMDEFRGIFGDFDRSFLEMENEVLDPDRTVPDDLPALVEDSPFAEYIPGYVLHYMDFSKVADFAASKYFITKDALPTLFRVQDGALQMDTAAGQQAVLVFTGNCIPQNAGNLTLNFEASFEALREGGYLAVLTSVTLNDQLMRDQIVDICIRNGVGAAEFPLPDGCSFGPGEYDNGSIDEAVSKAKWAEIGEGMAAGERIRFSFSFQNSKIDNIIVSCGDTTVSLLAPADKDTRDMGAWFGLMLKDMQMNLYSVQVVAGSVGDYTELTWPGEENALVVTVDPRAQVPEEGDGDGDEGDDSDPEVTSGEPDPSTSAPQSGQTEPPAEEGCASAVTGSFAVMAVLSLAGVAAAGKKKDGTGDV